VLEETGFTILSYANSRVYDAMVREKNKDFMVHHVMVFYDFEIDRSVLKKSLPLTVEDGKNDSDSEVWIKLDKIDLENSSPLVLKIKQEILGKAELDKSVYNEWAVK
jgi:hypothetical protein